MIDFPFVWTAARLAAAREALIEDILDAVARHGIGDGGGVLDPKVVAAVKKVPRECFVPAMEQADAYANRPLPIGHGQTISQPLIVALMTHLLRLKPTSKVLEVGTGSGYQAAILAELAKEVVTVEMIAPLAADARTVLTDLGYRNIRFLEGDGRAGSPEDAPFDAIILTAAAKKPPDALVGQLGSEGRMVAPIKERGGRQRLVLLCRDRAGTIHRHPMFPVAFVPLTGRSGDA